MVNRKRPLVLDISFLLNDAQPTLRQHQLESKKIEQELLQSSIFEQDKIPLKTKRKRASSRQLDILNMIFKRTLFPSTQLRAELGRRLGMSPRTVQIWFQNKRQAIKRNETNSFARS